MNELRTGILSDPRETEPGLPPVAALLEKEGRENFVVAPPFLPAGTRAHLKAVYGFARLVDDIGDETTGDRMAMLDWVDAELDRVVAGRATHPLLARLTPAIRSCDLPLQPFRDLVEANRIDQRVPRYETFGDLLRYCELSANPVGRLVLGVFGASTPERERLSDLVCTGLQLAEHLQDVGEDYRRGRIYLPAEDLARFGCTERDLDQPAACGRVRDLVLHESARARPFLDAGRDLAATLPGRVRLLVCAFAAGGHAALDAIDRAQGDVLAMACRPRPSRVAAHVAGLYTGAARTERRARHQREPRRRSGPLAPRRWRP